MYIDTHAHIYGEEFSEDIDGVIDRARSAGAAGILLPSTDEASANNAVALCGRYAGFLYPMLGLHPEDVTADYGEVLLRMEKKLQKPHPFVAIGEVGLDFYWDTSMKKEQTNAFCRQVEWSLEYCLPLMIHSRAAHHELVECVKPYAGEKALCGVFHCFSGSPEEAAELLDTFPSFLLGIGGIVTFKNSALPEVLAGSVPLNRIVLETDSPYMAPVPHRGKRNEPSFVPCIINRLAEIYQVSPEEVAEITTRNAVEMFKLVME